MTVMRSSSCERRSMRSCLFVSNLYLFDESWLFDCLFGWWFETKKDSFQENLYGRLSVLWRKEGKEGVFVFVVEWRTKKMTFLHAWCHLLFWVLIFLTDKKEASAIKGQWSDTWQQAMVWNTRLGARRSQVGREEGPQLRQKQELLIFSTIDSLQRSYNKWQHACVIFPIRDNNIHTMVPNMFFSFMMVNIFHLFRKLNTFTRICDA